MKLIKINLPEVQFESTLDGWKATFRKYAQLSSSAIEGFGKTIDEALDQLVMKSSTFANTGNASHNHIAMSVSRIED